MGYEVQLKLIVEVYINPTKDSVSHRLHVWNNYWFYTTENQRLQFLSPHLSLHLSHANELSCHPLRCHLTYNHCSHCVFYFHGFFFDGKGGKSSGPIALLALEKENQFHGLLGSASWASTAPPCTLGKLNCLLSQSKAGEREQPWGLNHSHRIGTITSRDSGMTPRAEVSVATHGL